MQLKKSSVDIPVLLIFFIRPDTFEKVSARVKEARPSKLYLCQDGPRADHPDDMPKILACRKIAENIDWECEVHYAYSDKNYGCDPNVYRGLKWVFEHESHILMLEDDAVPELSFFSFAKRMLDKYKDDERINMISSFTLTENWECPYDYFYAYTGTMSGCWATWKRSWDQRDESLDLATHEYETNLFRNIFNIPHVARMELKRFHQQRKSILKEKKITTFESIIGINRLFNTQLTIVPTRNMMTNIGMTQDATHGTANLRHFPKKIQKIFFMNTYPMPSEIKHPICVLPDNKYLEAVSIILGWNPVIDFWRRIESFIRRKIY